MRSNSARRRPDGFTVWDLLILVTTVLLFAAWGYAYLTRSKVIVCRLGCTSNLKQVGLAFRMWSNDHSERFPWQVSTKDEGTRELVHQSSVLSHLRAISNEVTTPKVFHCPNDLARTRATSFDPTPAGSGAVYLNNAATQISYFIGLDANETQPQTILSGDRNLTGVIPCLHGIVTLSSNTPVGWSKELHNGVGNVGLADGSAAQVTPAALKKEVEAALLYTNRASVRLALPQ